MKKILSLGLCLLVLAQSEFVYADSITESPHKIEFTEGHEKYYAIGFLDPHDATQFLGFQIYDDEDHLIQLINPGTIDFKYEGPAYTFSALSLHDFNFDGFPDIALPGDGATSHEEYFDIWLWDPKQKKFVENEAFNDAEISRVDAKAKRLFSDYSYHGFTSTKEYSYSSGKLALICEDVCDPKINQEVKTFYTDGKATKTITSDYKPQP